MDYEDNAERPIILELTKEQRWNLVQEGYNPLDLESVKRWYNKQAPDKTLAKAVAKVKLENLGSRKQNDQRDYAQLGTDGPIGDDDDIHSHVNKKPTRADLNDMVNERYSHSGGNSIDERVRARMKDVSHNESYGPIKKPRMIEEQPRKQMITEAKEAVNVGYRNGISYLNAFIANLKDPSFATRQTLIEQINKLVVTEDNVVDEQLKFYRGGIKKAEQEMYAKIKGNSNSNG